MNNNIVQLLSSQVQTNQLTNLDNQQYKPNTFHFLPTLKTATNSRFYSCNKSKSNKYEKNEKENFNQQHQINPQSNHYSEIRESKIQQNYQIFSQKIQTRPNYTAEINCSRRMINQHRFQDEIQPHNMDKIQLYMQKRQQQEGSREQIQIDLQKMHSQSQINKSYNNNVQKPNNIMKLNSLHSAKLENANFFQENSLNKRQNTIPQNNQQFVLDNNNLLQGQDNKAIQSINSTQPVNIQVNAQITHNNFNIGKLYKGNLAQNNNFDFLQVEKSNSNKVWVNSLNNCLSTEKFGQEKQIILCDRPERKRVLQPLLNKGNFATVKRDYIPVKQTKFDLEKVEIFKKKPIVQIPRVQKPKPKRKKLPKKLGSKTEENELVVEETEEEPEKMQQENNQQYVIRQINLD